MFDVFIIDVGGFADNINLLLSRFPHAIKVKYVNSHLSAIKRAIAKAKTEFVWVLTSCADYTNFDFSFIPVPWEQYQLHCWAANNEKFGDTFLINVGEWKKQESIEKLEWYKDINWHEEYVPRLPWPTNIFDSSLVDTIHQHTFESLYEYFTSDLTSQASFTPILWENRSVHATKNGEVSLCPRDIKAAIKTQIYDWPYIQYHSDPKLIKKPQDIVFISYGEENADTNYATLLEKFPYAKRVSNVTGILNALKDAAMLSNTPWFYAVFAKTIVSDTFKFDFTPDYHIASCNYIFNAYNPILDYAYGHGGIVLHDKNWLLTHEQSDIDITMSHNTFTVPELSCKIECTTKWDAWRTAFRETFKLIYFQEKQFTIEREFYIYLWLTRCNTIFGQDSINGANAAKDLFNTVDIKKINDWKWVKQVYDNR